MDKKVADITLQILGDIRDNVPQSKYWGDVSPLSHRDRRPCRRLRTPDGQTDITA